MIQPTRIRLGCDAPPLEGLLETRAQLQERGIAFALCRAPPAAAIPHLAADAALLVMDRGSLRPQQEWWRGVVAALAGSAGRV